MEKEFTPAKSLEDLATNIFVVEALLNDYCRNVAKLENIDPEAVKKRITEDANRMLKKFQELMPAPEI